MKKIHKTIDELENLLIKENIIIEKRHIKELQELILKIENRKSQKG